MDSLSALQTRLRTVASNVARELVLANGVIAVAQGGSVAAHTMDELSDVDLYVYVSQPVDPNLRAAMFLPRALPGTAYLDHHYHEGGDVWTERSTGVSVDVMYRDRQWIEQELRRVLDRHEPSPSYTTALLYNIQTCLILQDEAGWLRAIQSWANQPYPDKLATAILNYNLPLLRDVPFSYMNKLQASVHRLDVTNVTHVIDNFVGSYFDVLFALNRKTHPGDKRMLDLVERLPLVPSQLRLLLSTLIQQASTVTTMDAALTTMDVLIDRLEELCR